MSESSAIEILVSLDFQAQLRKLAKRYRSIRSDLQPLFDDLETGNRPDDQIPGTSYYCLQSPCQKQRPSKR
ncbi:hypothetical protein [Phormidesmis sp. 146-33]